MSQKTEQDSRPSAEAVDVPEVSVEHSTELLTGSAPCAGVSRPLPAAWLGQRGIYRSRFEAVCNGEQLVEPLTLGELIQRAWPSPSTELAERGTQHRFSTTEQTCRHDFYGVWWNDSGVTKTGRECRHCGFFVADMTEGAAEHAEAERPEGTADLLAIVREAVAGAYNEWKMISEAVTEIMEAHERIVGELRAENAKLSEALNRLSIIRARLNLRLDYALAKISKLESRWPGKEVPQAWHDIQAERRRQNNAEGWTPEHDDLYCAAELPRAAAAYILSGANDEAPALWPFVAKWWKPATRVRTTCGPAP